MNLFSSRVLFVWSLLSGLITLKISANELSFGQWMEWSQWTTCTEKEYCFEGSRERYRDCQFGKGCVGIEAESQMCPDTSCTDRPMKLDILQTEIHSFIAEECSTYRKFLVRGRFGQLMRHNITRMFPGGRKILENSYYNFKVTPKTLPHEKNIYRYCFEPEDKDITLGDFKSMFSVGTLRFKYISLQCALPKPGSMIYVTGFTIGLEEDGRPYGIYVQVKAKNGFKSVYYRHMPGPYSDVYNLLWS